MIVRKMADIQQEGSKIGNPEEIAQFLSNLEYSLDQQEENTQPPSG